MLTRILRNSPNLCHFFDQLGLDLYQPQRRHILNMADALLVCEDTKTLAALQRQFVERSADVWWSAFAHHEVRQSNVQIRRCDLISIYNI